MKKDNKQVKSEKQSTGENQTALKLRNTQTLMKLRYDMNDECSVLRKQRYKNHKTEQINTSRIKAAVAESCAS